MIVFVFASNHCGDRMFKQTLLLSLVLQSDGKSVKTSDDSFHSGSIRHKYCDRNPPFPKLIQLGILYHPLYLHEDMGSH